MASKTTKSIHIDVNGTLRLFIGGQLIDLRPKERAVLAAIAFHAPRPAGVDAIMATVWDDDPPATARKSIHNHVARLRRVAGDVVLTSSSGYELSPTVTIEPFRNGTEEPFADLADVIDVTIERVRVHSQLEATDDVRLAELVRADRDDALPALRAATLTHPLNEQRWWLFALQLARRGRRRESLLAFTEARDHLSELGLVLGEKLEHLERIIVRDDPSLFSAALLGSDTPSPSSMTPHANEPAASRTVHPHRSDPFVGRRAELDQLCSAWADVVARQQPHLVMLEGPSGSGKTRLADVFVETLRDNTSNLRVMVGRSRHTLNRAYGTLTESFSDVLTAEPQLQTRLNTRLAGLAHVVPQLDHVDIATHDESLRRSRLVQSVRTLLAELALTPTVWCLDDVQWTSADTIGVIDRALDGLSGQLMIIATARTFAGEVGGAVAALHRTMPSRTLTLPPLSVDEVSQLFDGAIVANVTDAFAHTVHARTGGLALYASEIARVARTQSAEVDPASVPTAIREFVTRRIDGLDPLARSVLDLASVIGERVDAEVLTRAATADASIVARTCDELVSAGLLRQAPTRGDQVELSFAHTITHEIVYGQLGVAARAQLHRAVAAALESWFAVDGRRIDHTELAHHYGRAGAASRTLAARHARHAGHEDFRVGAWASASRNFAMSAKLAATNEDRAEALVDQGRAELRAERFATATAALTAAIDLARLHGFACVQAEATLALVGRAGRGAVVDADDAEQIRLLRAAIRQLERLQPRSPAEVRRHQIAMSDLERELAFSLLLSDAADERSLLLARSVERMRSLSPVEPAAFANALLGARYEKLAPERLTERLADIDEVLSMRVDQLGHEVVLAATSYHIEDLLRAGRIEDAGHALADAEFIADRFPSPYWRWAIRAWRGIYCLLDGDLDRAEAAAVAASALRPGVPEAEACLGVNMVNIRLYQGRAREVIPLLRESARRYPEVPLYRAVLALCLVDGADAGDEARCRLEASRILRDFAARQFDGLPNDTNRSTGLAVFAHVAASLGDEAVAPMLSTLLTPFVDQWVVLSAYGGGGAVLGPASHALARLAATQGDDSAADRLFAQALHQSAGALIVHARVARDQSLPSLR